MRWTKKGLRRYGFNCPKTIYTPYPPNNIQDDCQHDLIFNCVEISSVALSDSIELVIAEP